MSSLVNKDIIKNVRQKFLAEYETDKNSYYEADIERVKNSDWPIERFALVNKEKEDATLKALVNTMKWRKSYGVLDRQDKDFPKEIYQCIPSVPYNKDKEGRPLLITTAKYHHKSQELAHFQQQFCVHFIEKLDSQTSHQGWGLIMNTIDSGLSNMDMDFSFFFIKILQEHYPRGPKYLMPVELPWILNATWKILKNFMSEELRNIVLFVNRDELKNYVNENDLPKEIGFGTCEKSLLQVPDGCLSCDQMDGVFNKKQVEKIKSTFKEALKDNPA